MRCGDFVRLRGTLPPHSVPIVGLEGRQIGKITLNFSTGLEELKPLVLNTNLNLLGMNDLTGKLFCNEKVKRGIYVMQGLAS